MMEALITGFPGFIGTQLLAKLAEVHPRAHFHLLLQSALLNTAEARIAELGLEKRVTFCLGDLLETSAGLDVAGLQNVTQVWHLAAIYDLSVPESLAHRVNVLGTQSILRMCPELPKLKRLMYFSTCYVSGRRQGKILESELRNDDGFKNHYESTKYQAECLVRDAMAEVPTTVIRPSIVVGDSKSGVTDKYDGPYYIIKLVDRLPKSALIPMVGAGEACLNLVPVDYIVDAAVALSTQKNAIGETVALADADPPTIREFIDTLCTLLERPKFKYHLPVSLYEKLLSLPMSERLFDTPKASLEYMGHGVMYDTANAQRLLKTKNLKCPALMDYLPRMVGYLKANPQKTFLDGRLL